MKNLQRAREWLRRAKSNLARAKAGRTSEDILYEDLRRLLIFKYDGCKFSHNRLR